MTTYVKVGGSMVAVSAIVAAILLGPGGGGGTPTPTPTATATSTAVACSLNATTSTFAAQAAAATAGQTVCLAAGDYGSWAGVSKSSPGVTFTPAGGAAVEMTLNFRTAAQWMILDGIDVDSNDLSLICAPANNITIRNADFRRELDIWAYTANGCGGGGASMQNAGIVIEDSLFSYSDDPSGADLNKEGRLSFIDGHATHQAGVTIRDNVFDGSVGECGDFIQFANNAGDNSGRGVTITHNEFKNLDQGRCDDHWPPGDAPHSDTMQGVGMGGVTISDNYIHDNTVGIVNYDFVTDNVRVRNNVIHDVDGPQISVGGSTGGLVIEHNTVSDGEIRNATTHQTSGSFGTVIRNNIVGSPVVNEGSSTATQSYNLCLSGTCTGTGSLNGAPAPTWVGGSNPITFAGWALAPGSRGENAGSDGTDIGVVP